MSGGTDGKFEARRPEPRCPTSRSARLRSKAPGGTQWPARCKCAGILHRLVHAGIARKSDPDSNRRTVEEWTEPANGTQDSLSGDELGSPRLPAVLRA